MPEFSGRVALVTGASRGIGLAIAERLVGEGATVVLNARHVGVEIADRLNAAGPGKALALEGSIAEAGFVRDLVKAIHSQFKRLDILVNNAGLMRSAPLGMMSDDDVSETLAVNLGAVLQTMQVAARLLTRTKGSIVNVSSIVGLRGASGQAVYAAAKAGVVGATLAAAKELAPSGVRVNAVAPGYIATDLTAALGDRVRDDTLAKIGLGRAGDAAEVAEAVVFLASDRARYITGQVLGVDGGMAL